MGRPAAHDHQPAAGECGAVPAAGIMTEDKRRPIDRIELPPGVNRDELRADIEGMRSLLRTGQELRSNARQRHIARTIRAAEHLADLIMGDKVAPEARLGIQYLRFRQSVLSL